MVEPDVPGFCVDTRADCRCREPAGHEPPHVCPCGGSWHYEDGEFYADSFPPLEIRPDLRFDEEW